MYALLQSYRAKDDAVGRGYEQISPPRCAPVAFCDYLSTLIATKLMISPTPMIHVGQTARVGWQSQRRKWQHPS